tara:strand:+ start:106 stop:711 length:606 start_codon:yes stop_codon:yes gene_type:complete
MSKNKQSGWYKTETGAVAKIDSARSTQNWSQLASEIKNLQEARIERATEARNGKAVVVIQENTEGDFPVEGGRFLIRPPLVARDAAILNNAMKNAGVAAVVACREPVTSLGLCPIVALGSGVTARVQVKEPKNPTRPTCAWFDHALDELGQHVLEQLDEGAPLERQLDFLIAHFSAIPTCINCYKRAIALCKTLLNQSNVG